MHYNNQSLSYKLAERMISNAWQKQKLASCYLFFGPEGTGRMHFARSLAMAVNCQNQTFPPCGQCSSCRKIDSNNHPDVHYIRKLEFSFIKIEQIHQMHRDICLRPFEGKCKAFIITNTEDLTAEASNSLLKIIEEPPGDSLIILIASDPSRVFPTITSRCQKIRFFALDRVQAKNILQQEYNLDERLSHYLAFAFEGHLGEALKFRDSNIMEEKNSILNHFIGSPGSLSDDCDFKDKEKMKWVLKVLSSCVRDIYLLKVGVQKQELVNQDISRDLLPLAQNLSFGQLYDVLQKICDYSDNLRQNINPRLLVDNLEMLLRS